MRLIDAEHIVGCSQYINTDDNFNAFIYIDDLVKLIEEQPTAYDIDKVVEELEKLKLSYFLTIANTGDEMNDFAYEQVGNALDKAISIVQEASEEYKSTEYINCSTDTSTDGWIPTYEKLPPDDSYILLSFSNFSVPIVGRYEEYEDGGGNFFCGDDDETLISHDLFVNAWMPLPKCYEED